MNCVDEVLSVRASLARRAKRVAQPGLKNFFDTRVIEHQTGGRWWE